MPKKPKKPPIEKTAVTARLSLALDQQLLVHVRRWIPDADRLDGFVVGAGTTWVALQKFSDRLDLDGWTLIRRQDVQAITLDKDPDCFEVRALRTRDTWPPTALEMDLDERLGPARFVAQQKESLLTVFNEFDDPDACWIGTVTSVDEDQFELLQVDPRANWKDKTSNFDVADITRFEIGGEYETILLRIAGRPPARTSLR